MPKKKEDEFNNLRDEYIKLCKEANKLQIELKKIDIKRENILQDIRSLQKKKLNSLDYNLLLNINNDNDEISDQVNKNISNSMIISNSSNSIDKMIFKKPLRNTDKETDDEDSVNLSDDLTSSDE
tara:strand:- start:809 stop:1183 length:375 start_codon:yes stop_codon:yes gene_type:complete